MKCTNPFTIGNIAAGCGQCMPCRFNRRRIWAHRIMLEAGLHRDNAFVTLTYDDAHLPAGGHLAPSEVQAWLKRVRKSVEPERIRFFGVGEYGDTSGRPHYHFALFGYPTCAYGSSRFDPRRGSCCPACDNVFRTWGRGIVHVGRLEDHSAQYIAGYVTKKMTSRDDERLQGRHPEFARMSLRPGIGFGVVKPVADLVIQYDLVQSQGDVPVTLRHGSKEQPLGRYLRRKIREAVGMEPQAPQATLDALAEEMRPLQEAARIDSEAPSLKHQLIRHNRAGALAMEKRARIFKQRRTI